MYVLHVYYMYTYYPISERNFWSLQILQVILIIEDVLQVVQVHVAQNHRCLSTKQIIRLRNRHCHRFITFTVVYFTFCFRKKYFFNHQFYNETFFTFFCIFQNQPQIFPPVYILSLNSSILPIAIESRLKRCGHHLLRYFS